MKSKFNVIDIIIFTAVFAICFSAIMLLIRDFSVASYSVDVTVCIEDGVSAVFIKGETAEFEGKDGKITGETVADGKKYVTVTFESARADSMPLIGEKVCFTTKRVYAEGTVYSVTEKEEDKE